MIHDGLRRHFLRGALGVAGAGMPAASKPELDAPASAASVRAYGAVGDGRHLDTRPIQAAVDACAASGGGTVLFPPGTYVSGTIFLRSRVTLHLEAGATILGSMDLADYPAMAPKIRSYTDKYADKSLLYGEDLDEIAITGRGVIDGRGAAFLGGYKHRPNTFRIIGCRNVLVSGVTLKNSPGWMQHYLACEGLTIRDITVDTRRKIQNNDGMDIDSCQRVRISGCDISCGDDAICLKSTLHRPCKDIVITNCVLSALCNGIKFGTESMGGFENIAIANCTIYETWLSGIALETVDGGTLDRVAVSNIVMHRVGNPIFIRLGSRGRPVQPGGVRLPAGRLRNVVISNIEAVATEFTGGSVTGLAGYEVENVTLENIRLEFPGGGTRELARREIPELPESYPEFSMFGDLPSYGLFCRHVKNLNLRNIELSVAKRDDRPALRCENVQGMELAGAICNGPSEARSAVVFHNVRDAFVHGCRSPRFPGAWLEVSGQESSGITLRANDFSRAARAVEVLDSGSGARVVDNGRDSGD
jgi:hypothetical protein